MFNILINIKFNLLTAARSFDLLWVKQPECPVSKTSASFAGSDVTPPGLCLLCVRFFSEA